MKNYYGVLGVSEDASNEQIKKAFKDIAKKEHPDRGGNESVFKEANEAYDTLKDNSKRQEYDAMRRFGTNNSGRGSNFNFNTGNFDEFFGGDFFEEFMSGIGGQRRSRFRQRVRQNKDIRLNLTLSIKEIMKEQKRTVSYRLPSGRDEIVQVKIPAGVQSGVTFRYSNAGDNSDKNLPRGSLLIKVAILDSDGFTRKGSDLYTDKHIDAFQAMRGIDMVIRDLEDKVVRIKVPAGTQPGSTLALQGKGMPVHKSLKIRGNMYVKIHVSIPKLNERQLNKIKDLWTK